MAGSENVPRSSIRARLIKSFTVAILIPSLVTAVVGVLMIRQQTYIQAVAQVTSKIVNRK